MTVKPLIGDGAVRADMDILGGSFVQNGTDATSDSLRATGVYQFREVEDVYYYADVTDPSSGWENTKIYYIDGSGNEVTLENGYASTTADGKTRSAPSRCPAMMWRSFWRAESPTARIPSL